MDYYDQVKEAADAIGRRVSVLPAIGLVLGSGLGHVVDALSSAVSIDCEEVPHWPVPRISGHEGRVVIGKMGSQTLAVLVGRSHAYEGYGQQTVTLPVRALGLLGIKVLVLTNAAGGLDLRLGPPTLMVIDDHINLLGSNPLTGPNDDRLGPRFPDMSDTYSRRLRDLADRAAREAGIALAHGVYVAMPGPSYETPAEVRYLRTIGADAVGMSTVPEAIVARHMGIEVLGISCITNLAAGLSREPLKHADVLEAAQRLRGQFLSLLERIVDQL
jgi:purine-nucleoside phosphorylase